MKLQDYVEKLLAHMGVEESKVRVEESETELHVYIEVSEEESGLLIGVRGETLSAIQRVVFLSFRSTLLEKHMSIHVNDYLERREERLKDMVRRAADEVLATGQRYRFDYLNSKERLIVHTFVGQEPGMENLETVSEGEGDDRRLYLGAKA